jgi:pimeloyl-ACP methyl ester carboxylesterase
MRIFRRVISIIVILLALYHLAFWVLMPPFEWYHEWKLSDYGVVPTFISHEGPNESLLHGVQTKGEEATDTLIVFIHGSPGGASAFHEYHGEDRLLEYATLVSVDRPGFGLSRPRAGLSLELQGDILIDWLETREEENIVLV